eukprot:5711909-Amphidinium_carterae.1
MCVFSLWGTVAPGTMAEVLLQSGVDDLGEVQCACQVRGGHHRDVRVEMCEKAGRSSMNLSPRQLGPSMASACLQQHCGAWRGKLAGHPSRGQLIAKRPRRVPLLM